MIRIYRLKNKNGMEVEILNFGAIVRSIKVPYKNGKINIVLGYDEVTDYLNDPAYLGAVIGRCANRIAYGKFNIEGTAYHLNINNGENHLHGGKKGFNRKYFDVCFYSDQSIEMRIISEDGDENYPGKVELSVIYTLTDNNELKIKHISRADQKTLVNITHHSYFNLSGNFNNPVTDHVLKINSDFYTPVNENLIPSGDLEKVDNSAFDFREPKLIGQDINMPDKQIEIANGYDHNYFLNGRKAAVVFHPDTGIKMEIETNSEGLQFYSGNFLEGIKPDSKSKLLKHSGFCLEPQFFPDAINQKCFKSPVLKPGEIFEQDIIYRFIIMRF